MHGRRVFESRVWSWRAAVVAALAVGGLWAGAGAGVASAAAPDFVPVSGSPFGTSPGFSPSSAVFSRNGLLATASFTNLATPGQVAVFSVGSGGALNQISGSPFATGSRVADAVAFSPSGGLLAAVNLYSPVFHEPGAVSMFSVGSGGALTPVTGSPFATGAQPPSQPTGRAPISGAFSPNGRLFATANYADSTVSMFSVASNGALTLVSGFPSPTGNTPSSLAFSPSGHLLATANFGDNTVSVFSVATDGDLTPVNGSPFATGYEPASLAFSASGQLLATGNEDGTVSVFAVKPVGTLGQVMGSPFSSGSDPGYNTVAFSSTGLLAVANAAQSPSVANAMSVYRVASNGALTPVSGSPFSTGAQPEGPGFSVDGQLLAVANYNDGTISVYRATGSDGDGQGQNGNGQGQNGQ